MALIGKSIPNLVNGVSEQPAEVRLPSQCEEQVNFLSSVVEGLKRRPGTQHVAKLIDSRKAGAFVHVYSRDEYEKYIVVVTGGGLRVFDLQGNEKVVTSPKGLNYLATATPAQSIKAVTVADYTFLLNKERVARAYDPLEGITLVPVQERVQRLSFRPLDDAMGRYQWSYWQDDDDGDLMDNDGWEVPVPDVYDITVTGIRYRRSTAEGHTYASVMAEVAANLSRSLGRAVSVDGTTIRIPLKTGENGVAFTDASYRANLSSTKLPGYTSQVLSSALTGKEFTWYMKPETGNVLTSLVQTETTGYTNSNGDALPDVRLPLKQGVIFVRQGDYGTTYTVKMDNVSVATVTTGTSDRPAIGTTRIAQDLYNLLAANANVTSKASLTLVGNSIVFTGRSTSSDFTLGVEDSGGGNYMTACKGRVQSLKDLPAQCKEGFTIMVAGQAGSDVDDYYVKYTELTKDGTKTSGSWVEIAKEGLNARPAPETMPHRLISNADGSFTFEPCDWSMRTAGDEDSAPEPSFINRKINDVFFYKNRLGLLADENIVLSEAGSYYMFYPSTVMQFLDSHPIDVAVTNDSINILQHAVPFNEALLLFSDRTQFIIAPDDKLTAETIAVDVTTRFEASMTAKPVPSGKNVFFPAKRGNAATLREYYVDPDSNVNDAADVASHCPSYLKGDIRLLASAPNEDTLACATTSSPNSLYVYRFYWQGNEKVQSSWSRWDIGGYIHAFAFLDNRLYLVIDRPEGVCIEVLDLSNTEFAIPLGYQTELCLDRLSFVSTGSKMPWTDVGMVGVDKKGNKFEASALEEMFPTGVVDRDIAIGMPYKSYYQFSKFVLLEGESRVAPLLGKLQMRSLSIKYVNAGYFKVVVDSVGAGKREMEFTGRRIGAASNVLGRVPVDDGTFRVPVWGNNENVSVWIETSSHLPAAFLSAEWEALYHRHSRRA